MMLVRCPAVAAWEHSGVTEVGGRPRRRTAGEIAHAVIVGVFLIQALIAWVAVSAVVWLTIGPSDGPEGMSGLGVYGSLLLLLPTAFILSAMLGFIWWLRYPGRLVAAATVICAMAAFVAPLVWLAVAGP
jgi:hypothetical protein